QRRKPKMFSLRSLRTRRLILSFSQQTQLPFFQRQQLLFDRQSATVPGEFAIRSDHAVTRDDDRNRIRSVRQPYRAARVRIADSPRQFPVRNRLAIRNFEQFVPDLLLEGGAFGCEMNVEGL